MVARVLLVLAGVTSVAGVTPFYTTFTGYTATDTKCSGSTSWKIWMDTFTLLKYAGCTPASAGFSSGCCLSPDSYYYSMACDQTSGTMAWMQYSNAACSGTGTVSTALTKSQCYLDSDSKVFVKTSGCFMDKSLIPAGYDQYSSGSLLSASRLLLATLAVLAATLHTVY